MEPSKGPSNDILWTRLWTFWSIRLIGWQVLREEFFAQTNVIACLETSKEETVWGKLDIHLCAILNWLLRKAQFVQFWIQVMIFFEQENGTL